MKLNPAQLHDLYCILIRVVFPNNPDVTQMLTKADTPEGRAKPSAISGLRAAINDLFAMHAPFLGRERELINAELARRGLPPLHVIEASRTKKYRGIIKRGKIRDEEEFYLVKGFLDDQDPLLKESEQAALAKIMSAHLQQRSVSKRRSSPL